MKNVSGNFLKKILFFSLFPFASKLNNMPKIDWCISSSKYLCKVFLGANLHAVKFYAENIITVNILMQISNRNLPKSFYVPNLLRIYIIILLKKMERFMWG